MKKNWKICYNYFNDFKAVFVRKNINGSWQDESSMFSELPSMAGEQPLDIRIENNGYFYKV